MATRNNVANRGESLIVFCPKCQGPMKVVKRAGTGPKGTYWTCDCGFAAKHQKGDYISYVYKYAKK